MAHVLVARATMRPPAAAREAIAISIAATAIALIAASAAIDLRL